MTPKKTTVSGPRRSAPALSGAPARLAVRCGLLVALAGGLVAGSALFPTPALAHHFTGEVQLWVSKMSFQQAPGGVLVTVELLEREYGESVSGFGVRVAASGHGTAVGPIELQESGFAVYTAVLPLGPGRWEIRATAHQGSSSLPAIESAQRTTLEIDATGRVLTDDDDGLGTGTILAIVLPIGAALALLVLIGVRRRRLVDGDEAAAEAEPGEPAAAGPAASP